VCTYNVSAVLLDLPHSHAPHECCGNYGRGIALMDLTNVQAIKRKNNVTDGRAIAAERSDGMHRD
jgi:hypothetical protein